MTKTVTETKKSIKTFLREYLEKLKVAWPCVLFFFFIYVHILMLWIFPSEAKILNTCTASLYQIIGAVCVLIQIDGSLKILKGSNLVKSIKHYLSSWPKRTTRTTIINLKAEGITCKSSFSATVSIGNAPDTLEEKINLLTQKVDEIDKKITKNRRELLLQINKIQDKNAKQIEIVSNEIQQLRTNLETTVVGDYKIAIFGVLMIIYGIIIPMIGLYTE